MNPKAKVERLKAIKEEMALVQAKRDQLVKLEEAAEPTNLSNLLENDLEQAELILAAQDVMTRLQEMAEDLAKTSARDLFPLADRMKAAFGPDASKAFEQSASHALDSAMEAVRAAKDELGTAILKIEGKIPASDMAMADDAEVEPDMATDDLGADMTGDEESPFDDSGDEFAGADAASGPEEEPLGRAKKESVEATKSPLRENAFDYRKAGAALLERESMSDLLGWVLTEAAAAMDPDKFGEFARSVKIKAEEDPEATAGWIGKKRYGAAAMAQLAAPTMTASMPMASLGESVEETEELEERARFDDEDEDEFDDRSRAKKRDMKRKAARNRKWDAVAEGIAKVIDHNVFNEGRGNASAVVAAFAGKFGGLFESEDGTDAVSAIVEAFEECYGMKPAAYSMSKLKEFSQMDKKVGQGALAAVADKLATDRNAANKPISAAMTGMSSQERTAVQKAVQTMKKDGNNPTKLGDLVDGADDMADGKLGENINAAHWPTDKFGQYKGEPMSTDYGKLKAPKSGGDDRKGVETKSAEPKAEEAPAEKAPEAPKEKPVSKFARKAKEEAPKEEKPAEDASEQK